MRLEDALTGVTRLGIDTAPIIYFVEANPHYDARVTAAFQRIANGDILGITSVIALTEVLVHPFRLGQALLQQQYRDLLLRSANFLTLPIGPDAAELGAELRARYNLRVPDALQIAVAVGSGCTAFLTNDTTLQRVTELRVLVLDDLAV